MQLYIQGTLKSKVIQNKLIIMLVENSKGFADWYHNKFLKWDGLADYEDERVLNESIEAALNELSKTTII